MYSRDIAGHSVVHHWNKLSQYRLSTLHGQGAQRPWPDRTDLCCWHCTETFDSQPVGIPVQIRSDGIVLCDGNFCSYSCALTHIFSQKTTHREYRTKQLLVQVAREVHGVSTIKPAPPRLALAKFGGPLSIDEFRNAVKTHIIVVNPPFISRDVVYEESGISSTLEDDGRSAAVDDTEAQMGETGDETHQDGPTGRHWAVHDLRIPETSLPVSEVLTDSEPLGPALFADYVQQREAAADDADALADAEPSDDGGDLARFMRAA